MVADYDTLTLVATIPQGSTSVDVFITVIDDLTTEGTETVNLRLVSTSSTLVSVDSANNSGTVSIVDNDAASVSVADISVNENAGNATVTVTLAGSVMDGFTVTASTAFGSTNADDFTALTNAQVFFAANSQSGATQIFSIAINNDNLVENSETLSLTLSTVTGGLVTISTATSVITIIDNDAASISVADISVNENAGNAQVVVTLAGSVMDGFTVIASTAFGSTDSDDFTALTNAQVFFAANSQSGATQVFSIAINNDVLVENDETLRLTLSTVTGGLVSISTATSVITIIDNDAASISVANISVNEEAGNATVTVTLAGSVMDGFTVTASTAFGSTNADDFTALTNAQVFFADGSVDVATQVFIIAINNDNLVENDETLSLTLSTVTGGLVTISTAISVITIVDNDAASISVADISVNENAGNATVTVALAGSVMDGFTVTASTAFGSTNSDDFTALTNAEVFFAANSQSGATRVFSIVINNDNLVENDETLSLTLSTVTGGLVTISTATSVITIIDNDAASISVADISVNENAGNATVTVALAGSVMDGFTVTASTAFGSTNSDDFTALTNAEVFFADGSVDGATRVFSIAINNDNLVENSETLSLTLSTVTGGLVTISTATSVITIVDNDAASVSVADISVNENAGNATVTVTLAGSVMDGFTVTASTAFGSTNSDDFTALTNAEVFFAANSQSGATRVFSIAINNDNLVENSETLSLTLSTVTGGLVTISTATSEITIIDNDAASVSVADISVNEECRQCHSNRHLGRFCDGWLYVTASTVFGSTNADDFTALTNAELFFAAMAVLMVQRGYLASLLTMMCWLRMMRL